MKDNVGQRAPAHRSPRQDPCFDPLIRSPVSRDSRAAASGSFLDWKGLTEPGAVNSAGSGHRRWSPSRPQVLDGERSRRAPAADGSPRERVRPRRSLVRRPLQARRRQRCKACRWRTARWKQRGSAAAALGCCAGRGADGAAARVTLRRGSREVRSTAGAPRGGEGRRRGCGRRGLASRARAGPHRGGPWRDQSP